MDRTFTQVDRLDRPELPSGAHIKARRSAGLMTLAVVIGVLASPNAGTVAQSASPDPLAPAVVTGTLDISGLIEQPGTRTTTAGSLVTQLRGSGVTGITIDSSDDRLSGDLSIVFNEDEHKDQVDSVWFAAQHGVYQIRNGDGSWSGSMTGLSAGYDEQSIGPAVNMDSVMLQGEGAYEGLTAYLLVDWKDLPKSFHGVILPGEWPPATAQ